MYQNYGIATETILVLVSTLLNLEIPSKEFVQECFVFLLCVIQINETGVSGKLSKSLWSCCCMKQIEFLLLYRYKSLLWFCLS